MEKQPIGPAARRGLFRGHERREQAAQQVHAGSARKVFQHIGDDDGVVAVRGRPGGEVGGEIIEGAALTQRFPSVRLTRPGNRVSRHIDAGDLRAEHRQ